MRRTLLIALILFVACLLITSAQDDEPTAPVLTLGNMSCELVIDSRATDDAEATPEPNANPVTPILTLSDECEEMLESLHVPQGDTLWLSLSLPDEEDWLTLTTLEDDDFPPTLDRRERFFGCHFYEQGEQLCRVLIEWNGVVYEVQIPLLVTLTFTNSPPPIDDNETQTIAVYNCTHLGDDVFEWYSTELVYEDGVIVSETIIGGPFAGSWQPNCPAGEPASDSSSDNGSGSESGDGGNDSIAGSDPPPPPPDGGGGPDT